MFFFSSIFHFRSLQPRKFRGSGEAAVEAAAASEAAVWVDEAGRLAGGDSRSSILVHGTGTEHNGAIRELSSSSS